LGAGSSDVVVAAALPAVGAAGAGERFAGVVSGGVGGAPATAVDEGCAGVAVEGGAVVVAGALLATVVAEEPIQFCRNGI
jgi:hypothetical protein